METGKTVCVTGASGYIASWVVKLLLLRGYSVNATVRRLNDLNKIQHLLALEGAKQRLHLFRSDLTQDGSFDSAINSCIAVFHTASPIFLDSKDPQAELIEPAVKGTINVMRSCSKASSVKRVVLTSSVAAMLFNGRPVTPDTVVDETWFSDHDFCRNNQKWYGLSKTLAEEAALDYTKDNPGFDLITICPGRVVGPLLQPAMNASSALFFNLITAETYVDGSHGFVSVKDVAEAHIRALETESASGRCVEGEPYMPRCKLSRERAESLGIEFTPLEVAFKEMVESLKEKQFVRF